MKIKIYGEISLVSSVILKKIGNRFSVGINTKDRWIPYQYKASSGLFIMEYMPGQEPKHFAFMIEGEHHGKETAAEVVVYSENESDDEILGLNHGVVYSNQDKDQIEFLLIPRNEVISSEILSTYRYDPNLDFRFIKKHYEFKNLTF